MYDRSQLMRGSLEGCILKIVLEQCTYGYEIMTKLKEVGFQEISEGTIYPILLRLEKQGNITSSLQPSPLGPKRKYYTITDEGKAYLTEFYDTWKGITGLVQSIMEPKQ